MDAEDSFADEPLIDPELNRTLSQWEIDSLLGAMGTTAGEERKPAPESKKRIRPYDFRRPDKFSKEHLRALQTIHESFARGAASSMSSYLRTTVQVRLTSVEQAVYGEYIQQLENPTVINVVTAEPLPGPLLIEINFALAFSFMNRLLGGTGNAQEAQDKGREVTDIELALLRTMVKGLLVSLRESWMQLSQVNVHLDDIAFNPNSVQAALPGDVGVLLIFELRFGDSNDSISMFIPFALLEPIIDKLSSQMWFSGVHKEVAPDQDEINQQLQKVEVPILARLGSTTVTVRELLSLQQGNVIRLDTSAGQDIEVLVGGKRKFKARPGRLGRNLGVVITQVVSEEQAANKKTPAQEALLVGA